jgi:hypothetical protein
MYLGQAWSREHPKTGENFLELPRAVLYRLDRYQAINGNTRIAKT